MAGAEQVPDQGTYVEVSPKNDLRRFGGASELLQPWKDRLCPRRTAPREVALLWNQAAAIWFPIQTPASLLPSKAATSRLVPYVAYVDDQPSDREPCCARQSEAAIDRRRC